MNTMKQSEIKEYYNDVVSINNASVKNSWIIILKDNTRIIRHYRSDVLTFKGNTITMVDANYSPTTRKLVNRELPEGYSIFQKNYQGFVNTPNGVIEYKDGLVLEVQ